MCGAPLREDEAAGEVHREITLVTSDLKGSTALGERLDPEALREVLNRYFDVMRAVFGDQNSMNRDRPNDVLDRLLAHILEIEG